jgi:hypothetical protein
MCSSASGEGMRLPDSISDTYDGVRSGSATSRCDSPLSTRARRIRSPRPALSSRLIARQRKASAPRRVFLITTGHTRSQHICRVKEDF